MRTWTIRQIAMAAGLTLALVAAERARADFFCSAPTKVANVNVGPSTLGGSISADGLELYFAVEGSGYGGMFDMYVATRASTEENWGKPVNLGPTLNGATWEYTPNISTDGLSLYFSSDRPGGSGGMDLWMTTRPEKGSPWGKPVNLGPTVNSSAWDLSPRESADGLSLLFHSQRPGSCGGEDIWMATRATTDDPWGKPVNLGPAVNSGANDGQAVLSSDGLALFFNSDRLGGSGSYDLWVTMRRTTQGPWTPPVNLGPSVNSPAIEWCSSISADGSTLYFTSDRPTVWSPCSIYQTSITPIVDFNGDGRVDDVEVGVILKNWGKDVPLCDMGPTALGDGVIDMQDLAVLTKYASGELIDPSLIACWTFDEMDGMAVAGGAELQAATLVGGPVWCAEGAVGGSIELDGVDDCVLADFDRDPSQGVLSVFAWVKGGKPGQVILAQQNAANWLLTDAAGALMTELKDGGRQGRPLISRTVITDGKWHRVGLVWDGAHRTLYVNDEPVAEDAQGCLKSARSDLVIGAGTDLAPDSFWSGLADEVHIYNRVIKP